MVSDANLVLIVEDELLIRMSLVEELEDAGFLVLEAGTADEALEVMDAYPNIEALFTDIDMPGSMNGLRLAEFVHNARPETGIILTSGLLKVPRNDLPSKIPFLPKPYDIIHVINHIREQILQRGRRDCFAEPFKP